MHRSIFMKRFVFIAVLSGIILIVSSIIIGVAVTNYQNKTFPVAYDIQVKKISTAIDNLAISEGGIEKTVMYANPGEDINYSESAGNFLRLYIGISKDCGISNGNCFAKKYKMEDNVTDYNPDYEGSCAILKNNMSICLKPQIGNDDITGVIDVNGAKGPNLYNKDLRTFSIDAKVVKSVIPAVEGKVNNFIPDED